MWRYIIDCSLLGDVVVLERLGIGPCGGAEVIGWATWQYMVGGRVLGDVVV